MQCQVQDPLLACGLATSLLINYQKAADISVSKLPKSSYFHYNYYYYYYYYYYICLRLKLVFVAVSIVHCISRFYSCFLFSLNKTSLVNRTQIQQLNWSLLHSFVLPSWAFLSAILPHGQMCNTKMALVIGPFLESTHSLSSINQLNLADVFFGS